MSLFELVGRLVLGALGAWNIFDGVVSLTYWADIDKTEHNIGAQAVRVVRVILGVGAVIVAIF